MVAVGASALRTPVANERSLAFEDWQGLFMWGPVIAWMATVGFLEGLPAALSVHEWGPSFPHSQSTRDGN
jgi:hypothetical protein